MTTEGSPTADAGVWVRVIDILALAGRWEFQASHPDVHPLQLRSVTECIAQLRALVDAADSPHIDECGIDHDKSCCRQHGTHSMPHVGCILR